MTIIKYSGEMTVKAVKAFCKKESANCFIFYQTIFSEVVISKCTKLPSSKHSANDWVNGYYHNGKLYKWSKYRKIQAQNAGQTKD